MKGLGILALLALMAMGSGGGAPTMITPEPDREPELDPYIPPIITEEPPTIIEYTEDLTIEEKLEIVLDPPVEMDPYDVRFYQEELREQGIDTPYPYTTTPVEQIQIFPEIDPYDIRMIEEDQREFGTETHIPEHPYSGPFKFT